MGNLFCCVRVEENEIAVKQKFGKHVKEIKPGCHFVNFACGEQISKKPNIMKKTTISCKTKTKEGTYVTIMVVVRYNVTAEGVKASFYKVNHATDLIHDLVHNAIRELAGTVSIGELYAMNKDGLEKAVNSNIKETLAFGGYQVLGLLITDVTEDHKKTESVKKMKMKSTKTPSAVERIGRIAGNVTEGVGEARRMVDRVGGAVVDVWGAVQPRVRTLANLLEEDRFIE